MSGGDKKAKPAAAKGNNKIAPQKVVLLLRWNQRLSSVPNRKCYKLAEIVWLLRRKWSMTRDFERKQLMGAG